MISMMPWQSKTITLSFIDSAFGSFKHVLDIKMAHPHYDNLSSWTNVLSWHYIVTFYVIATATNNPISLIFFKQLAIRATQQGHKNICGSDLSPHGITVSVQ